MAGRSELIECDENRDDNICTEQKSQGTADTRGEIQGKKRCRTLRCGGAAGQNNAVNGAKTGHLAENIEGKDGLDALIAKAEALNPRLGVVQIPAFLYEKVAYRGSTEGIIAEVHSVPRSLEDLRLGERPLVMALESVEKPGNLGAVLRSADAAGADAVIVCDPLTDIWNPNLIRSSVGAVFSVPVAV